MNSLHLSTSDVTFFSVMQDPSLVLPPIRSDFNENIATSTKKAVPLQPKVSGIPSDVPFFPKPQLEPVTKSFGTSHFNPVLATPQFRPVYTVQPPHYTVAPISGISFAGLPASRKSSMVFTEKVAMFLDDAHTEEVDDTSALNMVFFYLLFILIRQDLRVSIDLRDVFVGYPISKDKILVEYAVAKPGKSQIVFV